jgi:hypothetical protein
VTSTPAGAFTDSNSLPDWAVAAILELDGILAQDLPLLFDAFVVPPPEPPAPAPALAAVPPPAPPAPEEPVGPGLDQAQDVASDTALAGGLSHNAVGVADQAAQGLGQHGGDNGSGSDSGDADTGSSGSGGGGGGNGGGNGAAASAAGGGNGNGGGQE